MGHYKIHEVGFIEIYLKKQAVRIQGRLLYVRTVANEKLW
jgi:hypothetical protein